MRKIILSLLLLTIISGTVSSQKQATEIPAFTFYKLDKTPFTNKDLAPNKLIFFCFFDVSCDHCQHAVQNINRQLASFKNTALYLLTLDTEAGIRNFMGHYGPALPSARNVTILRDAGNQFIKTFKPVKYPSLFLYSKDRKLLLYDDNPDNLPKFFEKIKVANKKSL